jgi:branched-chain amino acid aminotransferase
MDRSRVRAALRDLLRKSRFDSSRFRISVPSDRPGVVRITMEQFQPVPDSIREGVRCSLVDARRNHPESKTLGWMHQRTDSPLPEGVYEGLLVSMAGEILEGLSSNFFAILDGTLRTAGSGVLQGVSRHVVLEVAVALLPVQLEPIGVADIERCEETFLTSSTRGVIPIVAIDDCPVGSGQVGSRTRELSEAYVRWVDAHLEPLVP